MAGRSLQIIGNERDGILFPFPGLNLSWCVEDSFYPPSGLFASIGQTGPAFGISSNSPNPRDNGMRIPFTNQYVNYATPKLSCNTVNDQQDVVLGAADALKVTMRKRKEKKGALKIRFKVRDSSLRSFISGGIAGAVSRTAVAPLETIRTHLMVGSSGHSTMEVFQSIMKNEGWKGLFRGNFVNVIRVAPSKAIELFAYDTVKKMLTPKANEQQPKLQIPPSLVAGACAGVSSTLCTYPLELLKTRLTIEKDVYNNLLHAFLKILREEGPAELYRGLTPSLIGVVPYAATNYFAYDMLKKAYRKIFKKEDIGNIETLVIGSAAGAISSSATFPLEVARKHMQVGAVGGRQVYKNMLHALMSILENEGIGGLYRGLGPSCLKLVPAAGISFMCFEACKKILVDEVEGN